MTTDPLYSRTQLLLGADTVRALSNTRVILFGLGGVGGWTAEALIRSGVGNITIVDADDVCPTNLNRQMPALRSTIGMPKVQAVEQRLLDINPNANIIAITQRYNAETAPSFDLSQYDYVIDAIDSLADKALLILNASQHSHPVLVSSMGAALKSDPTKVAVAEFWNVQGCPLAAALRHRFRKNRTLPRHKFKCVFSPEVLTNIGTPTHTPDAAMSYGKVATNGSLVHITAIFGFTLAGLVVNDVTARSHA